MVTQVSRNPRLVCRVSAVPTYSCGASSLTAVENCAESATTVTPQISSSGSSVHSGPPNTIPTVSAQLPDSTIAQLVTQVRPCRPHLGHQLGDGAVGELCADCRDCVWRAAVDAAAAAADLGRDRCCRLGAVLDCRERARAAGICGHGADPTDEPRIPAHLRHHLSAAPGCFLYRVAVEHECARG